MTSAATGQKLDRNTHLAEISFQEAREDSNRPNRYLADMPFDSSALSVTSRQTRPTNLASASLRWEHRWLSRKIYSASKHAAGIGIRFREAYLRRHETSVPIRA